MKQVSYTPACHSMHPNMYDRFYHQMSGTFQTCRTQPQKKIVRQRHILFSFFNFKFIHYLSNKNKNADFFKSTLYIKLLSG